MCRIIWPRTTLFPLRVFLTSRSTHSLMFVQLVGAGITSYTTILGIIAGLSGALLLACIAGAQSFERLGRRPTVFISMIGTIGFFILLTGLSVCIRHSRRSVNTLSDCRTGRLRNHWQHRCGHRGRSCSLLPVHLLPLRLEPGGVHL